MLRATECSKSPCPIAQKPATPQFLIGAPAIRIRRNFMKTKTGYAS
jgi:hypothetical protein